MKLKLEKLDKALTSLENIYLKPNQKDRSNIDASIQRFEFTIELFWKMLKKILAYEKIDSITPRDTLK